jgi:hypothetical protein
MTEDTEPVDITDLFSMFRSLGLDPIEFAVSASRRVTGARTANPGGRPLTPRTRAIREAVLRLTEIHEVMTVRQVFYALEVAGVVPKDETRGYRPVQRQLVAMRQQGLLPWTFIADATRWMRKPTSHGSASNALRALTRTYRRNLWASQGVRVEVWLEKDALAGVVMEETDRWDVPLMVSRGTSSVTFLHTAGEAARQAWREDGVVTRVSALYDHDAAGLRIGRQVEQGLQQHAGADVPIEFELLAVRPEQIAEWNLPTRPAKHSDPEAAKFTGGAVELDAIPPDRLRALVSGAIERLVKAEAWKREQIVEADERQLLLKLSEGFEA